MGSFGSSLLVFTYVQLVSYRSFQRESTTRVQCSNLSNVSTIIYDSRGLRRMWSSAAIPGMESLRKRKPALTPDPHTMEFQPLGKSSRRLWLLKPFRASRFVNLSSEILQKIGAPLLLTNTNLVSIAPAIRLKALRWLQTAWCSCVS